MIEGSTNKKYGLLGKYLRASSRIKVCKIASSSCVKCLQIANCNLGKKKSSVFIIRGLNY